MAILPPNWHYNISSDCDTNQNRDPYIHVVTTAKGQQDSVKGRCDVNIIILFIAIQSRVSIYTYQLVNCDLCNKVLPAAGVPDEDSRCEPTRPGLLHHLQQVRHWAESHPSATPQTMTESP